MTNGIRNRAGSGCYWKEYLSHKNYIYVTHWCLNIKAIFPRYRDSHVKDNTVFNMGIPMLVRQHLYIEMAPDDLFWNSACSIQIPSCWIYIGFTELERMNHGHSKASWCVELTTRSQCVVGVVIWPHGMMGIYSDNIQYAGDGRVDQVLLWGRRWCQQCARDLLLLSFLRKSLLL